MSGKNCGNCDYQGEVTQQRVECMVDLESHERGYSCQDFKDYVPGKNQSVRLAMALEKRKERAAKASEQRNREFAEELARKDREHADEIAQD